MTNIRILWADDEIELLKPHIIFLKDKGYEVISASSGSEALDLIKEHRFDARIASCKPTYAQA